MISEEEISQVRNATDIVALVGMRTALQQRRNEFWACCPFHDEKTPSFKVNPATQFYYCFGCGESGDVFTFTMKTENVDFPEAVRILAQIANIELSEDATTVQRGRRERLLALLTAATAFYHQQLMRVKSPKNDLARDYLKSRSMGEDTAKQWQIGYAPGNFQLIRHLRELGFEAQEMVDADVARVNSKNPNQLIDRFYDRIMFPISDLQGRPIAFGARVFLADDQSPAKYMNSAETMLFKKRDNLYAIDKAKSSIVSQGFAIVVEGYTDTIALHKAGFANTVATLGTALTSEHLKILARFTERVILLFDGDAAGQRAADRAIELIGSALAPTASNNRRVDIYVAMLPSNQDPAEYVEAEGATSLQTVLDEAIPLIRYGLDRTLGRFALDQPEQRSRAEALAMQILLPLKNTALASDYLSYLANRFGFNEIAETELRQRFDRLKPNYSQAASVNVDKTMPAEVPNVAPKPVNSPTSQNQDSSRQAAADKITSLERDLLYLFIEQVQLRRQLSSALKGNKWRSEGHQQIAEVLLELKDKDETMPVNECLSQLTARLPEATASLSASRLRDYSGLEPIRIADHLVYSIREAKLQEAIDKINEERALLESNDPNNQELFVQLVPLQKELADLRKNFKSGTR
ncbi:MAG: DNA primase [Coriobacteriia bacterium]|nr:DNA primase [Coriobacteriia bacterium]